MIKYEMDFVSEHFPVFVNLYIVSIFENPSPFFSLEVVGLKHGSLNTQNKIPTCRAIFFLYSSYGFSEITNIYIRYENNEKVFSSFCGFSFEYLLKKKKKKKKTVESWKRNSAF